MEVGVAVVVLGGVAVGVVVVVGVRVGVGVGVLVSVGVTFLVAVIVAVDVTVGVAVGGQQASAEYSHNAMATNRTVIIARIIKTIFLVFSIVTPFLRLILSWNPTPLGLAGRADIFNDCEQNVRLCYRIFTDPHGR